MIKPGILKKDESLILRTFFFLHQHKKGALVSKTSLLSLSQLFIKMSFARKPSAVGNERHHPHTLSTLVSITRFYFYIVS